MAEKKQYGFDEEGNELPITGPEVQAKIEEMLDDPSVELIAVIVRMGDELAMPMFRPPSPVLLEALYACAHAVEYALSRRQQVVDPPKETMN